MLIAGWGKDAKDLGFVGIIKCSHCKNHGPMSLFEVAKKVSLYFVRVAKWQRRYYVVCPVCQAGSEVDAKTKDQILRESVELPDEQSAVAIWNDIDARVAAAAGSEREFDGAVFDNIIGEVQKTYPERHATYVATCYWDWLVDTDKAE